MIRAYRGNRYSLVERRWRTALTLVLAIYGWQCLRSPGTYRWLDSLDLAIHETGTWYSPPAASFSCCWVGLCSSF